MRSLLRILSILSTARGFISFILAVFIAGAALFILSEYALVAEVVTGKFPFLLFVAILPSIFSELFASIGILLLAHYSLFAFLFGIYVMLLVYIFLQKRYFSASSFSISALSLVGISFGISCLSCGALVGVLLFSLVGATTASVVVTSFDSSSFFLVGEILLGVSIILALVTIDRFERPI